MELHFPLIHYLIVCAVGLVMGVFGAILGSTLFVLVPLLNFLGLPLHTAIGTAKLSVIGREIGPILLFSRSGALRPRLVIPFTVAAVLCAHLGALWATSMDEFLLGKVVGFSMLAISLVTLWKQETGLAEITVALTWKQDFLNIACGIPLTLATALGSQIGARVALRGGSRFIRLLFLVLFISVAFAYLVY